MPTPNFGRLVETYLLMGLTHEQALRQHLHVELAQPVSNDDPPTVTPTEQELSALEGGTRLDWLPWQLLD